MKRLISKWRSLPESVKSSVAFTFSVFFLKGVSFIATSAFTRIMDMSEYGVLTKYNSWLSILEVVAVIGLTSGGVINSGLNDFRDDRDRYISSAVILGNVATVAVFGVIFLVGRLIPGDFMMETKYLVLMFIHLFFSPAQIFWLARQRYEYRYKLATLVTIFSVIIGQTLSVLAVVKVHSDPLFERLLGNECFAKLVGNEAGQLLFYIPIYVYLLAKGKSFVNRNIWRKVFFFAVSLIPHYLAQHLMSGADKIMVADMVSEAEGAVYGVMSSISIIAIIFWEGISASLVPYTFEKINKKDYASVNNVVKGLLVGYGIICLGIIAVAPEVVAILAPSKYNRGIFAIPPLIAVAFLNSNYNIYANIEFYYKNSRNITLATIVSSVANLGLNALLIPRFSLFGAAYATLLSNAILIFMHYTGYRRSAKDRIYDDRFILGLSVCVCAICILSTLLYLNNIVRYSFIGLVLIAMVIKRKWLISTVKDYLAELKGKKKTAEE